MSDHQGATSAFGNDPSLPLVLAVQSLTTTVSAILAVLQNQPFKAPVYIVASLPTGLTAGSLAFASNARTGSEGVGAGTGALVQVSTGGVWQIVGTGLAPTV